MRPSRTWPVGDRSEPRDCGSAVVDFVLVSLLLLPLFVAILQLGLALYVRNTLAACAQDGARYAADADIVAQGGSAMVTAAVDHTTTCVDQALSPAYSKGIAASTPSVLDANGVVSPVVEVRIASPIPALGMFGLGSAVLHVKADALQEQS